MADQMKVSVVVTVMNEAGSIVEFLESLARQTRTPDELVIVDGGSTDGTVERIRSFDALPITLIQKKCNIARGRNIGIRSAQHELIAITDAGCRIAPDWLANISADLDSADVVVGNYRPAIACLFDACQYSLTSLFGSDKSLETFTISSRSLAFRRSVWQSVGGYPEWLDYSEDAYFHDQIRSRGFRVVFRADAFVEWSQRPTPSAVFLQYFRYMRGEALGRRHTLRNLLRYATYGTGFVLLSLAYWYPACLVLLAAGGVLYASVPLRNFCRLGAFRIFGAPLIVVPAMLFFIDLAKMAGYASGVMRLITRRQVPASV